jgi:HSP20 family molecular chaperone IbpA
MANVSVRKLGDAESLPRQLMEEIQSFLENIKRRAYELFETRGGGQGGDLQDWLQAERELIPETQVNEKDREFLARINVSGIVTGDIEVIATRNAILLEAPREARVLQRLEFPKAIDPDRVTAKLDKGILQVIAPKGAQGSAAAA